MTFTDHTTTQSEEFAFPCIAPVDRASRIIVEHEQRLWAAVSRHIEATLDYLIESYGTVNVLEIGGGTLCGLSEIRNYKNSNRINYVIADLCPPPPEEELNQLNGKFLQAPGGEITQTELGGDLHYLIAIRALEYDPNYIETLRNLKELAGESAYGLFIHNQESSTTYKNIRSYFQRLLTRESTIESIREMISGDLSYQAALSKLKNFSLPLSEQCKRRERKAFDRMFKETAKRLSSTEETENYLLHEELKYKERLANLRRCYGARIINPPFNNINNPNDVQRHYDEISINLIQNETASFEGRNPLSVVIHEVDLSHGFPMSLF